MPLKKAKKLFSRYSKKKKCSKGIAKAAEKSPADKKHLDSEKLNAMIKERAYFIWEEKGRPHGCDSDIWSQAETDMCMQINK